MGLGVLNPNLLMLVVSLVHLFWDQDGSFGINRLECA